MNRPLGLTLLTSALMVAVLAAQDDPPRSQTKDADKKAAKKNAEAKKKSGETNPAPGPK